MARTPGWWQALASVSLLALAAPGPGLLADDASTAQFDVAAATARCPEWAAADPFPLHESIRGNVDFWIRVFSVWNVRQVVIHDVEHPEIVYEILDLPGTIGAGYSDEQKAFLEQRRQEWGARLIALREKAQTGLPLDDVEKAWILEITTKAGSDALAGASERLRSQRGLRQRFREGLARSARYDARIREVLRAAGLPEDLAYLPHVESSFEPSARSSAGAVGLWQLTRPAGRRYLSINSSIDERLDPVVSTQGAARYLQDAMAALCSWPLALTSYNHGVQGMLRAKERFGSDFDRIYREYDGPYFGFASKNFYAEFLAAREIARDPQRFFGDEFEPEPPLDHDSVMLDNRATPAAVAAKYGLSLGKLAAMNPAWSSRAVRSRLTLPAGTMVWLPAGTLERRASDARPAPRLRAERTGRYIVRRGDTLSGIARALRVDLDTLRQLNQIPQGSNLITTGQALLLPPGVSARSDVGERTHVVRRGETLMRIAAAYGVRLLDLLTANGLTTRSIIRPGQSILIPSIR